MCYNSYVCVSYTLREAMKYERKVVHDGGKNTYSLEKDGKIHTLSPLEDEAVPEGSGSNILLMTRKEL